MLLRNYALSSFESGFGGLVTKRATAGGVKRVSGASAAERVVSYSSLSAGKTAALAEKRGGGQGTVSMLARMGSEQDCEEDGLYAGCLDFATIVANGGRADSASGVIA